MSHFTVLVIGPKTEDELEAALLPFHEFECTGVEAHIQEIDITEEALAEYEANTDESGNEGPTKAQQSFAEFVGDYYGKKLVPFGQEPNISDDHKYGYAMTDESGNVTKVVRRTNPNKHWDWYTIGGRWADMFILKNGKTSDSAKQSDLDIEAMAQQKADKAIKRLSQWTDATKDHPPFEKWESVRNRLSSIDDARDFYNSQPAIKSLNDAGFWSSASHEEFVGVSLDQVVNKAKKSVLTPFAIVKIEDGTPKWYERGSMGWWGMVSDEKSSDAWQEQVNALFEGLPVDTVITNVDCHI